MLRQITRFTISLAVIGVAAANLFASSEYAGDIDVSNWSYRKPISISTAGVNRIEFDQEILSRSQQEGGDIRVVRDGKQLPFIFDQSVSSKTIVPSVELLKSEKDSKISVWSLTLPNKNLFVSHLTCSTPETLFKRTVYLYEQFNDDRGSKRRRKLSQTEWIRSVPTDSSELMIAAPNQQYYRAEPYSNEFRLRSDTLLIAVINEDNQPLNLTDFAVHYTAPAVLFKSSSTGEAWLYYGNKKASRPTYDISLIAKELLAAEKQESILGKEEALKASRWWDLSEMSQPVRIGFWITLGLVVALLLIVIVRLLPEQGNLNNDR